MAVEPSTAKKAWLLIFLLCGQECLAARQVIETEAHLQSVFRSFGERWSKESASSSGRAKSPEAVQRAQAQAAELGPDALGKVELMFDAVVDEVERWSATRPAQDASSQASMVQLEEHLGASGVLSKLKEEELQDAMKELQRAKDVTNKVENLNLFLCKRTPVNGYTDTGIVFQERHLNDGNFQVKCTTRVNILNRGVVGDESAKGKKKQEEMVESINMLKAFTEPAHDDKFPIQLKICTKKGGCRRNQPGDERAESLVKSADDIFGSGGLSSDIPIPSDAVENLGRHKHQESHLFAVCYDQQDECDGMMWVPKNFEMCNGWFKADDAKATLGFLRDSVTNGGWFSYWNPKSANVRAAGTLTGESDQRERMGVNDDDAASVAGVLVTGGSETKHRCALQEWEETEDIDSKADNEEVLEALDRALSQYSDYVNKKDVLLVKINNDLRMATLPRVDMIQKIHQLEQAMQNLMDVDETLAQATKVKLDAAKGEMMEFESVVRVAEEEAERRKREEGGAVELAAKERLKEAMAICREAEEAGEGVDCDEDNKACKSLKSKCQSLPNGKGRSFQFEKQCPSREQMEHQLQSTGSEGLSPDALIEGQALALSDALIDASVSGAVADGYYTNRRRRRSGSVMMNILFPPYYYYHHPYCYPWYGYHGGFYAYPIIPNVGGYTFGLGTFHPGLMLLEGMGHLAFHAGRALIWAGGQIAEGAAWGIGNLFKFVGECKGDAAPWCIGAAVVVAIIVALSIVAVFRYKHCKKSEENCKSWWYRGGRLRTKLRKWLGLWDRVDQYVYDELGAYLLFDGVIATPTDKCMKKLQWGRQWARIGDEDWQTNKSQKVEM